MHPAPRYQQCSPLARMAGRIVLRLGRWRLEGDVPDEPRMVVIAAPHTSNWDLIYMLATAFSLGISVNWLGKDSLFKGPLGPILRYFGGIPVDRSKRNRMITTLAAEINSRPHCALVVPPEGTRAGTDHWKSGFYWIAFEAEIPVVMAFLDWGGRRSGGRRSGGRRCGIGPVFTPKGNVSADMERIRDFYGDMTGRFPDQFSTIRLQDEATYDRKAG